MDIDILQDYIDACELIKETEKEIHRLQKKRKTIAQTSVKGSNPEFPYQEQHFCIHGTLFSYGDDIRIRAEEKLLDERRQNAEKLKISVESWMNQIPSRMQRIIKYKMFEDETWEQVAKRLGRKATGDSVKMEFRRFMENR